ncbi:MAG: hypothetical protein PHC34_06765 [Candidatus Gastranaerophilales bacterium]|nr:hypothetical protein [Candidatus Gastranaerophilales bacterium]
MIANITPSFNHINKINNFTYRPFNNTQNKVSFGNSDDEGDSFVNQAKNTINSEQGGVMIKMLIFLMLLTSAFAGGFAARPAIEEKFGLTVPQDYELKLNGDEVSTGGVTFDSKSQVIEIEGRKYKVDKTENTVTVKDEQTGAGATANFDDDGINIKIVPTENSMNVNNTEVSLPKTGSKLDQVKNLVK